MFGMVEKLTLSVSGASNLLTLLPFSIIVIDYLSKKPPGMQTLLDLILVDLVASLITLTVAFYPPISLSYHLAPFHPQLVHLLSFVSMTSVFYFMSQFVVFLTVKYLSIFHTVAVFNFASDDQHLLKFLRFGLAVFSVAGYIFETFAYPKDHMRTFFYQHFTLGLTNEDLIVGPVLLLLLGILLVFFIYLQFNIEFTDESSDGGGVLRFLILVSIPVFTLVLVALKTQIVAAKVVAILAFDSLLFKIIPLRILYTNQN